MNYIELNNEVMNRKNGFFQLEKDQQAAAEFLKEVKRKSKKFDSILDKVKWMVQSDFTTMYSQNTAKKRSCLFIILHIVKNSNSSPIWLHRSFTKNTPLKPTIKVSTSKPTKIVSQSSHCTWEGGFRTSNELC